jgi:hypothetical protein
MTNIEQLITRARTLLGYMTEREVITKLMATGSANCDAFLAVKAAKVLSQDN